MLILMTRAYISHGRQMGISCPSLINCQNEDNEGVQGGVKSQLWDGDILFCHCCQIALLLSLIYYNLFISHSYILYKMCLHNKSYPCRTLLVETPPFVTLCNAGIRTHTPLKYVGSEKDLPTHYIHIFYIRCVAINAISHQAGIGG